MNGQIDRTVLTVQAGPVLQRSTLAYYCRPDSEVQALKRLKEGVPLLDLAAVIFELKVGRQMQALSCLCQS